MKQPGRFLNGKLGVDITRRISFAKRVISCCWQKRHQQQRLDKCRLCRSSIITHVHEFHTSTNADANTNFIPTTEFTSSAETFGENLEISGSLMVI